MLGCASNGTCMPCKICMLLSSTLFPCSYVVQLLLPVCVIYIYILWDSYLDEVFALDICSRTLDTNNIFVNKDSYIGQL